MNNKTKRKHIEHLGRCDWFDLTCPLCKTPMKAYQGILWDYALLCQTKTCGNYFRVAHLDDMADEVVESDFEELEKEEL